ncbi:MAG: DEAD/DEAH box helicase [archaeon]|nr:DEAD/DEAH box helicase [archaeon]
MTISEITKFSGITKFSEMAIDPLLIKGLDDLGITTPTQIQRESIPYILDSNSNHIMGQSKTGTGKTLAFAIPITQTINSKKKEIQAVVLVPTRELCKQISKVFVDLTKYKKLKIVEVYGGASINNQIQAIRNGGQIIIATPGRLIDLFKRGVVSFRHVRFVALDEADRMLDMGFFPDIEYLLLNAMKDAYPKLMLFSATLESRIKNLAKKFTKGKDLMEIYVSKDDKTVKNCKQSYYLIRKYEEKYANFVEIVNNEQPYDMIVFVRTKRWAEKLSKRLKVEKMIDKKLHFKVDVLHGDLTQSKRELVIKKFKSQEINCLVATNIAARGLDFKSVSHIFNYDFPDGGDAVDDYIHRIGRTARMDSYSNGETRKGNAISLVLRNQLKTLREIEKHIKLTVERKPLPKIENILDYGKPVVVKRYSDNHRGKNRSGKSSNRGSNRGSGRNSNSRNGNRNRGGKNNYNRRNRNSSSSNHSNRNRNSGNRGSNEKKTSNTNTRVIPLK